MGGVNFVAADRRCVVSRGPGIAPATLLPPIAGAVELKPMHRSVIRTDSEPRKKSRRMQLTIAGKYSWRRCTQAPLLAPGGFARPGTSPAFRRIYLHEFGDTMGSLDLHKLLGWEQQALFCF